MVPHDPFEPGPFSVASRTFEAYDRARDRRFPCEIWYPAGPSAATCPLVVYSHHGGGHHRVASFLANHLSSHGYAIAAMDHSEVVAAELAPKADETSADRDARMEAIVASRVPDIRFLIDHVLDAMAADLPASLDATRIGIVGHSIGGWTALATPDTEPRIGAVVAHAPAGSSRPKPGIIPATLDFAWGRDVPTLYLVAEDDVSLPLDGMYELYERTPASKQLVILRRADHLHFVDDVEQAHETFRSMELPGPAAWIPRQMRPITELCPGEQAHVFVRGLTLCHLDAVLRESEPARRLLRDGLDAELARRGIDAYSATMARRHGP
jgi:dienelactone hydrolase